MRSNVVLLPQRLLVVTLGGDGAVIVDETGETHVNAVPAQHPVDIRGAGDSFPAAAVVLAVTGSSLAAARLGNMAASVTIMKRGTGTASSSEILAASRSTP